MSTSRPRTSRFSSVGSTAIGPDDVARDEKLEPEQDAAPERRSHPLVGEVSAAARDEHDRLDGRHQQPGEDDPHAEQLEPLDDQLHQFREAHLRASR